MLVSLLITASLLAAPQFELQTLDGQSHRGELAGLTEQAVSLNTAAGPVEVPTAQVVSLRSAESPSPPEPPPVWVELRDGSLLAAESFRSADGKVTVNLVGQWQLVLLSTAVANVRLRQQDATVAAQWREIVEADHAADLIVVRKEQSLDFLEGIIQGVDDTHVHFQLDGETIPVAHEKVEGLVYFHPQAAQLSSPLATITDVGGSRLALASAAIIDGDLLGRGPGGVEFRLPLEKLASVELAVTYLSDLAPESAVWTPYFGSGDAVLPALRRFYRPRVDVGLTGGPLRLGGVSYAKGLALHSRSEVVYRLAEQYSMLRAVVGIDDGVRPAGHVRLLIYADERLLLDKPISGRDEPLPVAVELDGAARLRIVVDFGDDLDVSDHLNLCEPRLIP